MVIVSRLKRCWLCSVNLPRIGKQVQFTINANIPRQTAGNCSRFTKLYAYLACYRSTLPYYFNALFRPILVSRAFSLRIAEIIRARDWEVEREKLADERNRHEIWRALVPRNFWIICVSLTQTVLSRPKLEGKLWRIKHQGSREEEELTSKRNKQEEMVAKDEENVEEGRCERWLAC